VARLLLAAALIFAGAAAAQPVEDPEMVEEVEAEEEDAPPRPPVEAQLPDRPIMLRVGGALAWDSNIFRAPSASKERIASAYAGLSVDKRYAQQRFRLELTDTAYHYENFSYLDFNALNYLGAWSWQLGPRIGGAVSATRVQSLVDYNDFRQPGVRNVRTTENFLASAEAALFGGWHLTGGLLREQNRYSVPFAQEGSYRANGVEGGVRWVARANNSVAFNLRSLDGHYVDRVLDPVARIDDGFRRNETEAVVVWRPTGKSSFEGRAAWIDYRSDHFVERDFSGLAARLRYLWQPTAKLALNASLSRDVQPWSDPAASYRIEQRLALAPAWQPLARTTLRLEASWAESDFRGALPGFAGAPRHDRQNMLNFELEWRMLRNLSLKAGAQTYRQSSTDPAARIAGEVFTAGVSFLF
jgi:exopolysaccharide biosynthesis operon protein EpsL